MSLSARLLTFFLAALAVILIGFSAAVFTVVHAQNRARVHDRMDTAMETLIAAVEVHDHNVQWEPLERVPPGDLIVDRHVRWTVRNGEGHLIDCSKNLESPAAVPDEHLLRADEWWLDVRRMRAGYYDAERIDPSQRPRPGDHDRRDELHASLVMAPVSLAPNRTFEGQALYVTVAYPRGTVQRASARMLWTLILAAITIWSVAAIGGGSPVSACAATGHRHGGIGTFDLLAPARNRGRPCVRGPVCDSRHCGGTAGQLVASTLQRR